MKRIGNIYEKIVEIENVKRAILLASRGKRDRNSVKKINNSIDKYAMDIQKMLKDETYKPSTYVEMKIQDRNEEERKSDL